MKTECCVCQKVLNLPPARIKRAKHIHCSTPCAAVTKANEMQGNSRAAGHGPNATSFQSGSTPWNKGVKGIHLSPQTEFATGHKANKDFPLGTITIRTDKHGKKRRWIKMAEGWIEFAVIVWERHHGPVPKGFVVHHKNRNTLDDEIVNLDCLNRADHLKEHRREIRAT